MKNWLSGKSKYIHYSVVTAALVTAQLASPLSPFMTSTADAATQHANGWTIFAYSDRTDNSADGKHIQISGSKNVAYGDIKSNGDYHASGQNNVLNGAVRYFDNSVKGGNIYNAGQPAQEAFSASYPGTLSSFSAPACNFNVSGVVTLSNSSPEGVYCHSGTEIKISNSDVTKKLTIISNGLINISGQNVVLTPYVDNILLYTTSSSDSAIEWKGSGLDPNPSTNGTGLAFAPNGHIDIEGSDLRFCMQFAGQVVRVQGSDNIFNKCAPVATPNQPVIPTTPTTPVTQGATDVCPNMPGTQTNVPSGMTKDSQGNCVTPGAPTPGKGGEGVVSDTAAVLEVGELPRTGQSSLSSIIFSFVLAGVSGLIATVLHRRYAR